ncbi:MAG: glutamine-synthetase adenylyltransferase, partial [Alteraurantiacibacter sp.]
VQAKARLAAIVRAALSMQRDPAKLRADVLAMRAEVLAAKPAQGPLDVKLLRGGLVDSEFLVHYLQLREGIALEPALEVAIGQLADARLLPEDYAATHLALTRFLIAERLFAPDGGTPHDEAQRTMARACGEESYAALLQTLARSRQAIAGQWHRHFDQRLEVDA